MNTDNESLSKVHDYLIQQASVIYLQLDDQLLITDSNQFTKTTLGYNPVSKDIHEIFVDFSWQANPKLLEEWGAQEKLLSIEGADGLPQSYYMSLQKLTDGFILLGRADVNEIMLLRKQYIDINNKLANLTRELHKKNSELSQLNKLKNQFLGMAAHDLRKPAGIVQMFAGALLEELGETLSERHEKFLGYIMSSGVSMAQIINDFLDVALIESGYFPVMRQKLSFSGLLEENIELHKMVSSKNGIDIKIDQQDTLPEIYIDKSKIEQVLNNVVGNAIEHSPENGQITIKARLLNGFIEVSIVDQGPGIPESISTSLFRPFATDASKKPNGKVGYGLGLAISKKIIEAHGGEISANNNIDGRGATFTFTLPDNSS